MTAETVKFLGLTNPMLRECIDNLINTSIALQNSFSVIFGNLATWQANVKPSLPPTPKYMQEEVHCNTEDLAYNKYFSNAASVIEEMKAEAFKARQQQMQQSQEAPETPAEAAPRDYDPTVLLEKKNFKLNESA
ncbi:hypothetical protein IJI31_05475 [bacterium]|nr:hypothetical protein [bacterium]